MYYCIKVKPHRKNSGSLKETLSFSLGWCSSEFKTEKHFVSWLHLCPNNKVSGGKILSRKTRHYFNALKCAFRDAANVISKSKNQLGKFFRKVKIRKGYQCAVTATARKMAVIIYKMLSSGEQFKETVTVA